MVWGQWFGQSGKRGEQGMVQGYDHDHQGVVFGFERNRAQHRQGLLVGYAKAEAKNSTHKRKSDSVFVGAYGHQERGRFSLSGSIIVGQEQHKGQRWVLDNVNGEETARSSSRSHFVSPSLTLGTRHALQSEIELRPSATVAYTYSRHNGYSESGTTLSNLQVASRNHQAWATRVQLEAAKPTRAGEVYARVGVQSRHTKSGNIQASAAGNAFQFAPQSSTNVSGSYVGLGVNWHLNQQYKLLLDAETGRMSGNESYSRGQMTLQYWF